MHHLKKISRESMPPNPPAYKWLRKLKYTLPIQVLRSIYNSLILPHMHYALLAWGTRCHKIELLQKKALRIIFSKSPIAHTEPLLKKNESTKTL